MVNKSMTRWHVFGVLLVSGLLTLSPAVPAATGQASNPAEASNLGQAPTAEQTSNPCRGTIERPANGVTAISIQGYNKSGKQPAKIIGVGPRGGVRWVHQNGEKYGVIWSYDIDPLPNGNLFVTATIRGPPRSTIVYEFDPQTQERVWVEQFHIRDTHDADLINNGTEIVVANMRHYNETTGVNRDRIFVYNRTQERIVWQWNFTDHFPRDVGGDPYLAKSNYTHDWTHVNDVDKVGDGQYLVSPKHFDQVFVINRSTKRIDLRLGSDDDYSTLKLQHNPDYLRGANGTPTLVVADSENDRIVEYVKRNGTWNRTWTLGSSRSLNWPRDADRLANGNTLVTDTKNDRVFEATPTGRIVWEFAAPWLTYDAARLSYTRESGGPTVRELNASGEYGIRNSAEFTHADLVNCHAFLESIHGRTNTSSVDGRRDDR